MVSTGQPSPRERVIAAALAQVTAGGLAVSLDHISLEEVITASGVSRATAYRVWSNKQEFLADVMVAAVRATTLEVDSPREVEHVLELVEGNPDLATDPALRRHVVVDGLRVSVQADLERMVTSTRWATYLALSATARGLPDGGLRTEVTSALAQAERQFSAHRVSVYARLPRLLGYRLVPPLDAANGFEVMAEAAGALMTGFVVKIASRPALLEDTFALAAFGAGELEWTMPGFALTGMLLSYLEPDPEIAWDEAQVARFRATLAEITGILDRAWAASGARDGAQ
ncbi:TetR/AcrR family transcriptional regulator [Propionicimonas sp.]|uniref:TetR/AcrR family transcriptional regulator n=1 Tax=Propionicimonas sp. TaxID=1955623 RepID=UPI0039E6530F